MHSFSGWLNRGVVFLGIWILVSVWAGYIGQATLLTLPLAVLLTWGLDRKGLFVHETSNRTNPNPLVVGAYVLTLILIFGFIQGGFDLSADAAPSFAAERILGGTIPATYLPYFDLPFFYPPGLPVLVSLFAWTGIPMYAWMWFFGVLGIVLLLYFTVRIANELGIPGGEWILPVLILGLRFPLQSLLFGEYPLLLGFGLGIAGVALGMKRTEWFVLGVGAAALLHPYAGVVTFLAGLLVIQWKMRALLLHSIGITLLSIPMILFQLLPLLSQSSQTTVAQTVPPIGLLFAQPSIIGIIPFTFFAGLFLWHTLIRRKITLDEKRPMALVLVGAALVFGGLLFPALVFGGKAILLVGMGIVLYAGLLVGKHGLLAHEKKIAVLLVVGIILLTASSGLMTTLIAGSKATYEEASFARAFGKTHDTEGMRVLFLSSGHSKMAQYAKTIPYDALSAHFLTSVTYTVFHTPETDRIFAEGKQFTHLLDENCVACVDEIDADYFVVNTNEFPPLAKPLLEQDGPFLIYAGTIRD